jgi:hypothetical protein
MMLNFVFWTLAWRTASDCSRHAPRDVPKANDGLAGQGLISRSEMATWGWAVAAGVAAGLATLIRPSWLLFVPFAGMIGLVATRSRKRHLLITGLMLGSLCVTMLPWWIRNYIVAGRFVPTSLQVGASLYDGISPTATGASDMQFVAQFVAEQRAADAAATQPPRGLFEDRLDQRMKQAAVEWALQNPRQVLALATVKLRRMWSFVPNATEFQSPILRLALAATYSPVIVLALVGAWQHVRRDWPYLLCCLPAVYFTLLHIVFVSSIRYRQPAMLPLIVFAAAAIVAIPSALRTPHVLTPAP